jgi:hypothetical protein
MCQRLATQILFETQWRCCFQTRNWMPVYPWRLVTLTAMNNRHSP